MSTTQILAVKRNVPRKEAQARLGIGNTKFHELVKKGKIPVSSIGRRRFVRSDVLDRLIEDPSLLMVEAEPDSRSKPASA